MTPEEFLPLFVYGTLRRGRRNASLLDRLEGPTWRPGTVRGHVVERGHGGEYLYPAITLDPEGPEVEGEIFWAEGLAARWARLDEFEGPEYRRVLAEVEAADGEAVTAWIYEKKPGW